MDNGGKWLLVVLGAIMALVLLFAGAVPLFQATIEHTQQSTIEDMMAYWLEQGYVAYADPDGTLHVYDIEPNDTCTYDLGSLSKYFRNIYINGELVTTGTVSGDLIPTDNDTYDLGSATHQWKDLYITDGSIYLGGRTITADGTQLKVDDTYISAPGTPDYVVGVNTATDDVPGSSGYWVKSGATGQVVETNADPIVSIQWAIDTVNASGERGLVVLKGTFSGDTQIVAKSNVDVHLQGEIDIDTDVSNEGILFYGVVNSIWSGGTIKRQGTTSSLTQVIGIGGNSDRTLVIRDMQVISEIIGGGPEGSSGVMSANGGPTFINVVAKGSPNATGCQTNGFMFVSTADDGNILSNPLVVNCVGYAGGGRFSAGFMIVSALSDQALFLHCIGYGSNTSTAGESQDGWLIWDGGSPVLNNCTGYGGGEANPSGNGYGIQIDGGSSRPTINGGVFYGGIGSNCINQGAYIGNASAPVLNGVTGMPLQYSARHWYASDPTVGFKPFAGKAYMLLSMYVGLQARVSGVTLDIGTTVGGHEIGQGISLDTGANWIPFNLTKQALAADGLMYLTPSGAVPALTLFVNYTVAYNSGYQGGLTLNTMGAPSINACTFLAGKGGGRTSSVFLDTDSTAVKNWSISNSLLLNYDEDSQYEPNYALNDIGPTTNAPIYNCRIKGKVTSDLSFADGSNTISFTVAATGFPYRISNSGVATILNGNISVVVNHGLIATPTYITITGADSSEVKDCIVTGADATSFTIVASANVTDNRYVYWRAAVGAGN